MIVESMGIRDVLLIRPDVYEDSRGYFFESWRRDRFAEIGVDVDFVQDNHSGSRKGVLRGLHYQLKRPQGKLVRVVRGAVFDVAVDVRKGSPTFGKWVSAELSAENRCQLYVPPGFAHGFCVLSDWADFAYKCTDYYAPKDERGIRWNDPDIDIKWPGSDFSVSDKDAANPSLSEMYAQLPLLEEAI